ncbi:MAG: hypothetical protein ACXWPM_08760, partial [Bdellovibrionota bacterium]
VELDGARRYWNLYRRIDQARAQASAVAPADALHADFRAVDLPKDLSASALTSFYPFVSEYPALAWGVPPELSDFREILMKIRTARLILTVHQGEWEAELARAAYRRSGLSPREFIVAPEEFRGLWPSVHPAYGMVVERV